MLRIHRSFILTVLTIVTIVTINFSYPLPVSAASRHFTETGHTLSDPMLSYWQRHGGLPVFGYPISEAFSERSSGTEQSFLTQYFERNRFEAHPENSVPYHVLLGRLGVEALQRHGRDWTTFAKSAPNADHYFAQTGHAIAHPPFWRYWSGHGLEFDGKRGFSQAESLALFGYPISEPQMETNASGDTVLTQWFERARFEDHGANGVLLGLLGNEQTYDRRSEAPFQPVPGGEQPQPTPPTQPAANLHQLARQFIDAANQERTKLGMAPLTYRDDQQAAADQAAAEWTSVKKSGGNDRAVFDKFSNLGIVYAQMNVPLQNGCQGAVARPYAGLWQEFARDWRPVTVGVFGEYSGPCGRAFSAIYAVGF